MSNPFKIRKIIETWLDTIYLEELSNAEIESFPPSSRQPQTVWDEGISLVGDHLLIKHEIFTEIKERYKKLCEKKKEQDFQMAVAFPQIYRVEGGKRKFKPLFAIDISSIFQGRYRGKGWNLRKFEFQPVIPNLIDLGWLDEETLNTLVTREGLLKFLKTTFKFSFNTLQDFLDHLPLPSHPFVPKALPYLLRFDYIPYNYNLKKDLQRILDKDPSYWQWATPNHPAFEYLFGKPQPPRRDLLYLGAFPTYPPNDAQVSVFQHYQENPITAVIGPAGNGKTTVLTFIPTQQVVKRAYRLAKTQLNKTQLAETGTDANNLTLITSTNHRAVTNVLDNLTAQLGNERFCLEGGRKEVINGQTIPKLQGAIDWLENTPFDDTRWQQIGQALIQIAQELENLPQQESELIQQKERDLQEKERLNQEISATLNRINELKQQQATIPTSPYENYPLDVYEEILPALEKAIKKLPRVDYETLIQKTNNRWLRIWYSLRKFWQSLTKTSTHHILKALKDEIELLLSATLATSFPFQTPYTRESLESAYRQVLSDVEKARQWQNQKRRTISNPVNTLEQTLSELRRQRQLLEGRLNNYPTEDLFTRFPKEYHEEQQQLFKLSWQYLQFEALRRKNEVITSIRIYLNVVGDEYNADTQRRFAQNGSEILRDISLIFPVFASTLQSVRNLFPYPDTGLIDCTLVDEAGMIPLHQVFPALVRSKKAVLVGDPMQLEPIMPLSQSMVKQYYERSFGARGLTDTDFERYSPTSIYTATAYHRAAGATGEWGNLGESILLNEHYRCVPPIINLCRELCGYPLIIQTVDKRSQLGANLMAYHVEGMIEQETNPQEIDKVDVIISYLLEMGYPLADIGVISPYRAQVNGLSEVLEKYDQDFCQNGVGTVHTFQGGQKPVIIFSPRQCRSEDGFRFINQRPNLLYTAISRAEELFILVGNLARMKHEGGYIGKVVSYIEQYGEIREL